MPEDSRSALDEISSDRAAECLDRAVSLDELIGRATELTRERFARPQHDRQRVLLYAPLYLSSHCTNHCVYCGFRGPATIRRRHLDLDEAARQADILRQRGFHHILLVAGDFPKLTTTEYFARMIRLLVDRRITPALEIAPQSGASYAQLAAAGACGVTLYQETYNRELYSLYHPKGSKGSYDWRLDGLRRAAEAGMQRLGMGILLGLADPCEDLLEMVRHGESLRARFPDRTLAFSLPRIHEAPKGFETPYPVDDETFVRLYCTLRIAFPEVELVLSTRESIALRNRLAKICITQMSAGSSTVPGGYETGGYEAGAEHAGGQQFPVCDDREPAKVAGWLQAEGFEVAWEVA
ncbi:MAG: radical SAM protein [Thermoguttaceae bacterium]